MIPATVTACWSWAETLGLGFLGLAAAGAVAGSAAAPRTAQDSAARRARLTSVDLRVGSVERRPRAGCRSLRRADVPLPIAEHARPETNGSSGHEQREVR